MVKLGADATNENIIEGWHNPQKKSGTIFDLPIGLRQWCKNDVTLFHSLDLAL